MKNILPTLLLLCAGTLGAADLTGKWSGTIEIKDGQDSRRVTAFLILKQDGNKLTGSAGGSENVQHPIPNGTVNGNNVSFQVDDGETTYSVELKIDGEQLTGEVSHGDGPKMKMSLKRVQPASSPGYQALVKDAKSRIKEIDAQQLKALQSSSEKFTLIDVREDNEWVDGHATGATHIGKGIIEREIESKAPRKDAKLVLYCGGGSRSALAADALMKMGYSNVFSLAGGFGAYKSAGLPTEK
jgi:rhodanese-related sulfurtransferase